MQLYSKRCGHIAQMWLYSRRCGYMSVNIIQQTITLNEEFWRGTDGHLRFLIRQKVRIPE